nr:unnamed protein product [Digitaria exilis]
MQGDIAYDWNRSWSSGTLSMRLIWSYREKKKAAVYLREGRRLSRAPPETGSLRSDFTSCGSAPSAFWVRAAPAIVSVPLRRPVGRSF